MKTILPIIIVLLLISFSADSQVQFELSGKANYIKPDTDESTRNYTVSYRETLNDSSYSYHTLLIKSKIERQYQPKIGYELTGKIKIPLSKRFYLKTGIGLNYQSFYIDSETLSSTQTPVQTETVEQNPNGTTTTTITTPTTTNTTTTTTSNPPTTIVDCDRYDGVLNFRNVKFGPTQSLLHLILPLEFGYSIIPKRLNIQVGGFLQMPIYSNTSRETIERRIIEEDGLTICRNVIEVINNRSGGNINKLQFGASANIVYQCTKNISFETGIRSTFRDIFVKEEQQDFPLNGDNFTPLVFSAGFSYTFTKKDRMIDTTYSLTTDQFLKKLFKNSNIAFGTGVNLSLHDGLNKNPATIPIFIEPTIRIAPWLTIGGRYEKQWLTMGVTSDVGYAQYPDLIMTNDGILSTTSSFSFLADVYFKKPWNPFIGVGIGKRKGKTGYSTSGDFWKLEDQFTAVTGSLRVGYHLGHWKLAFTYNTALDNSDEYDERDRQRGIDASNYMGLNIAYTLRSQKLREDKLYKYKTRLNDYDKSLAFLIGTGMNIPLDAKIDAAVATISAELNGQFGSRGAWGIFAKWPVAEEGQDSGSFELPQSSGYGRSDARMALIQSYGIYYDWIFKKIVREKSFGIAIERLKPNYNSREIPKALGIAFRYGEQVNHFRWLIQLHINAKAEIPTHISLDVGYELFRIRRKKPLDWG